jgi:hypothetical protein
MPSVTTMALSTIMPMAMIIAPSEMRWRSMPAMAMTMNVPRIGNTNPLMPMMIPARMPIVTANSSQHDDHGFDQADHKGADRLATSSDCHAMRSISMPTGSVAFSSAIRRSMACPTRTTFSPAAGAMAIAIAWRPLCRSSSPAGRCIRRTPWRNRGCAGFRRAPSRRRRSPDRRCPRAFGTRRWARRGRAWSGNPRVRRPPPGSGTARSAGLFWGVIPNSVS